MMLPSALVAIALVPSVAHAAENTVELQIQSSALLDLVSKRALSVAPSCPEPFSDGTQDWIVDHLEWGAATLGTEAASTGIQFTEGTVNTHRPEIVLPVDVHLKTVACVEDSDCPLNSTIPFTLPLKFALTADETQICATFTGVGTALPPGTEGQVDDMMDQLGPMCAPLSLGSVTGLLGDGVSVNDVGLALSPSKDRIAVRLELDTPDGSAGSSLTDWQTFLGGTLSPSNGGEFSIFVDQVMLRRSFGRRLTDGMTCDPSDPGSDACNDEVEPTSSVSSAWLSWVPEVSLAVDVDVDVGAWCAIDIGLEPVSMEAPFALSSDHSSIQVDAFIDWDVNEWDVAGCVFLNPLFIFTAPMPFEAFLVMDGIAESYSAANELDGALPSECDLVDDHNVDCTFPFALPKLDLGPGPDGILEATSLAGLPAGLSLEGTITTVGFSMARQPLDLYGAVPTYGVQGDCNSLGLGYSGGFEADGGPGTYCNDPYTSAPSPTMIDDPLDIYQLSDIDAGPDDQVEIGFPNGDSAAFWAAPYPARIRVWSTVGAGTLDLGTPVEVGFSWEWIAKYMAAWGNCNAFETGLFGIPGKFDFHWLVDPPPYELIASDRVWNGARATLVDAEITDLGKSTFDPRTGALTIPGSAATLTTTWSIDGAGGSFRFTTDTVVGVDLQGIPLQDGFVANLTSPVALRIAVPRASLPRGLSAGTVNLELDPTELVLTGLQAR